MRDEGSDIVAFHSREILPLYNIPFDVIVGKGMRAVIDHGESLYPGASLKKASLEGYYVCRLTHPEYKTRYMVLLEVKREEIVPSIAVKLATELSWYFMDEVNIQCDNKNHDSQQYITMAIFDSITNVVGEYLDKVDPLDENDMGDL